MIQLSWGMTLTAFLFPSSLTAAVNELGVVSPGQDIVSSQA